MNIVFWSQIKEITPIAKDVTQVTFFYDQSLFKYSPGQYVWVALPELAYPDANGEQRAFSITSSVSDPDSFSIHFRNTESGFKKTLLSLAPGSRVQIIGPFGSSYVPTDDQKKVVMIAGGIGIAPFLSILRSIDKTQNHTQYTLLYLNASADSGVFYDELTRITSSHNFPFINHVGKPNEAIFPPSVDFANDIFFICGPHSMVDSIYQILLTKGVPLNRMHFEQHYPSMPGNLTEGDFALKPGERNIMLQAVQDSKNHVIITDVNGLVIFANKKAQENTGFTFDEMRGNTPRLWGGLMPKEFYQSFWQKKHAKVGFDGELTNRHKNGEIYYVLAHISPIVNDQNAVIGYIGTEEDITKEKQIDIAKTEFISLASHQLRTPLSTINWYVEMLMAGDAGPINEEQKKFLQEAYTGSKRMVALVNALLNVSRIESNTYMVNPEPIDVMRLLQSVLAEMKPKIENKKIQVHSQGQDIPIISLDPNLTTIIFQNLLTNAIKYTNEAGSVTVTLRIIKKDEEIADIKASEDCLLVEVQDTGMGIPKDEQSMIFTKLFRAHNVQETDVEGTGLGLYLIKGLIERSKGKIWFFSDENKGTTFFVMLPLAGMEKKEGTKKLDV